MQALAKGHGWGNKLVAPYSYFTRANCMPSWHGCSCNGVCFVLMIMRCCQRGVAILESCVHNMDPCLQWGENATVLAIPTQRSPTPWNVWRTSDHDPDGRCPFLVSVFLCSYTLTARNLRTFGLTMFPGPAGLHVDWWSRDPSWDSFGKEGLGRRVIRSIRGQLSQSLAVTCPPLKDLFVPGNDESWA